MGGFAVAVVGVVVVAVVVAVVVVVVSIWVAVGRVDGVAVAGAVRGRIC